MQATAIAHSNIALVKYWGKRDVKLNLPAVGSISITLDALSTKTKVQFDPNSTSDTLFLNGNESTGKELKRITTFLEMVRKRANLNMAACVESENNFPTAAGLASSASAFAALALASTEAAGLDLSENELTILSRRGSGSAARSIYGGFVEMHLGKNPDGYDSFAEQIEDKSYWDLRVLIAVTSEKQKKTGSTDGMTLSRDTSPYYKSWIGSSPADLNEMRQAIREKDFQKIGELSEFSCLKMHALALGSNPGLIYWNGTTVDGMHAIRELRQHGSEVYFTIDAGPQLKALCLPSDVDTVKKTLENIPGVQRVIHTALGDNARIIGE